MAKTKKDANGAVGKNRIAAADLSDAVVIKPANLQTHQFRITGTAPYVQHAFGQKARLEMLAAQQVKAGTKKKPKEKRDPEADYRAAMHIGIDGQHGIPCAAFRNAMISACRVAGFVMTRAKLSLSCQPDTFDEDGIGLVHIEGEPEMNEGWGRLENGTACLIFRPMWKEWAANVRITYDGDQFQHSDVANLLERAGLQVGIGEGRPDSKKSAGMGWGTFTLTAG